MSNRTTAIALKTRAADVISEPRKGVTRARLAGAKAAKYNILAFIDADAFLPPGWLDEALVSFKNPKVVGVSGPLRFYDGSRFINLGAKGFYVLQRIFHLLWVTMQGGNYLIRRDAVFATDCLNHDVEFYGEDT